MILTENIPEEMRVKKQWVGWQMINSRKVPMSSVTGKAAQSNNPDTWSTFEQVKTYLSESNWNGLGYVFNKDYVGVDLDHCIDDNGLNQFAKDVIAKCSTYTEYSPSKKGIHLIGRGDILRSLKTDKIEIYNIGRYFTMTGHVLFGRKQINSIDVSSYYQGPASHAQSIESRLNNMKSGNVDNTLTSLAGTLFRQNMSYQDVFTLLKLKANQQGHDDNALHRICRSVQRYHPQGEQYGSMVRGNGTYLSEKIPIEIFTPTTHSKEFIKEITTERTTEYEFPTGFPTIDKCTGGLKKRGLWVVGARTGIGKTSFSITVAANLLKQNKKVLIFSTETTWIDIFARFISMAMGISLHILTNARRELTSEDKLKIREHEKDLKSRSLFVIEESEPDLRTIVEEISRVRPDVFIFDYIQHVAELSDQRHIEIGKFMKGMENAAKTYNCAGLITSQLNRAADVEKPALRHLSDSSTIENTAHTVILLSKLTSNAESDALINAEIAKKRGLKCEVMLKFDSITAGFKE